MKSVFKDVQIFMEAADQSTTDYNLDQSSLYMKLIGLEFIKVFKEENPKRKYLVNRNAYQILNKE